MSECMARKFTSANHTFLTKRFDRTNDGKRIHFSSAMTQLGYTDGADAATGVSYLELVDFITSFGAHVKKDLHELWRRIVFSICVSNTDDHLRNHGFLLSHDGWHLSPAFDINPIETGTGLKLNISENDNALDLALAMEVHEYFRLDKAEALKIIETVRRSVSKWREVATRYGISKTNQEIKAAAFKVAG
jgi:serine/threonine-protein kinase HipA